MSAEKIFQEALALPPAERERLVGELLRSLEGVNEEVLAEAQWEAAWTPEIERRLRDLDEGRATAISHEEFKARVRARLSQP